MVGRRTSLTLSAALAAFTAAGCGSPSASSWPRPPGTHLALSREIRSQVDTESDKTHYRRLLITSPRLSSAQLLGEAVSYARLSGWRVLPQPPDPSAAEDAGGLTQMTSRHGRLEASVSPLAFPSGPEAEVARRASARHLGVIEVTISKRSDKSGS